LKDGDVAELVHYRIEQARTALFDTEFVQKDILPSDLSRDFHRGFEMRQRSDYRATEPATIERAEELLTKADRFVAAVRDHLRKAGFPAA
jgi:uncharacterized protein (UPF0332 family)